MKGVKGFQKGNRAGGRTKGLASIVREKLREKIAKTVEQHYDPMLDAQIANAKGLNVMMVPVYKKVKGKLEQTGQWKQVKDPDKVELLLNGSESGMEYYQIWTMKPSKKAFQYLTDQVVGKPRETVELEGNVTLIVDF